MIQASNSQLIERILGSFSSGCYAMHSLLQLVAIEETTSVPTAAVECKIAPRLLINPEFVREHADTTVADQVDRRCVLKLLDTFDALE